MHLVNQSPFSAVALPAVCHEDRNHIVVVVKGAFDISSGSQVVTIADEQTDIHMADEYWGEPGASSLRYEADIAITKPGTDVALIGNAWSMSGPVRQLDVSLRVGTLHKVIRVFGNRYWEKSSGGWRATPPEAFESLPLTYENAYGGSDPLAGQDSPPDFDERNPVGRGYACEQSLRAAERIPLPNLELPGRLITDIGHQPDPAGFGFVARNWQPRSLMMGTYDEAWEEQRNPLLPTDFDTASYSAASNGLCSAEFFVGGEQVIIDNASSNGQVLFALPSKEIKVVSYIDEQRNVHECRMDTVIIEPELSRLTVTWRVAIPCHWNLAKIEWIKVLKEN